LIEMGVIEKADLEKVLKLRENDSFSSFIDKTR